MDTSRTIDTTFDFRLDTPPGQDPDKFSPTLRRYHKLLWSKSLPSGAIFELEDTTPASNPRNSSLYLRHGFEVMGTIQVGSSPVVTPMIRHPR